MLSCSSHPLYLHIITTHLVSLSSSSSSSSSSFSSTTARQLFTPSSSSNFADLSHCCCCCTHVCLSGCRLLSLTQAVKVCSAGATDAAAVVRDSPFLTWQHSSSANNDNLLLQKLSFQCILYTRQIFSN
jgi:hypothetical protein